MSGLAPIGRTPSFSFLLGGRHSADLLPGWQRSEAEEGPLVSVVTHDDPETGLRVVVRTRRFEGSPAIDWVLEFENRGDAETPIIEGILPLDAELALDRSERVFLHHANGSLCRADDFLPRVTEFAPGAEQTLAPVGGRSSNGALPFMNLHGAGHGAVLAVGWSGQWRVAFERTGESLRVAAGMERTRLRLYPGEAMRTPRILVLPWEGDDPIIGQNLLRRLLIDHYLPRIDGELVMPPTAQCLQAYFYLTGQAGQAVEEKALPKAAAAGAEAYWLDACWYGRGGEWWQEVGSWTVDRKRFPEGLRPLADAAHREGMKFVLWFEPERVRPGSEIHEEHPEFLLRSDADPDNFLLNLGNRDAWNWIFERVSSLIAENGVDIYRQDFNFDPLPYWREADETDRVGMTEIRYVGGHYRLWDELRRAHPGLWIDNCASGGRRIDLETLSRSLPLWPSDFTDVIGLSCGMDLHVGDQCITAGLARWVPLFGGGVWNFTPYGVRGQIMAGFTYGFHVDWRDYAPPELAGRANFKDVLGPAKSALDDDFPMDQVRLSIAEWRSLRPFFVGDFYPLVPVTVADHDWCAYQMHRADMGAGFALYLRRHRSPFSTMEAGLGGLDPEAAYSVSLSPGFEETPRVQMTGAELAALDVIIPERPGSMLLRYSLQEQEPN